MRQAQALQLMMDGTSIFLTGAPGAGKTHVLNEFIRLAKKRGKNVAVTASTGIAATHIGGTTIHSWSGLGIQEYVSEQDLVRLSAKDRLVKRYNATDVLVIDEVSMLHGRRLDMVNMVAKKLRQSAAMQHRHFIYNQHIRRVIPLYQPVFGTQPHQVLLAHVLLDAQTRPAMNGRPADVRRRYTGAGSHGNIFAAFFGQTDEFV
jgi:predicted ATPase